MPVIGLKMRLMEEKDKEILLNKDVAQKFADMIAKCLMPDVKILERLSTPNYNIKLDDKEFKWEYKLPNDEQK